MSCGGANECQQGWLRSNKTRRGLGTGKGVITYLERGRDDGLRGHDGSKDGDHQTRVQHARRDRVVERVVIRRRVHGDVRSLATVREQQARVRPTQPAELDGPHREGAQVGEQRLDAGEGQQDAAEHLPPLGLLLDEEPEGVVRVEGLEDGVIVHDEVVDAKRAQEAEPDDDDGRERRGEPREAERLDGEEQDEDAARRADHGRAGDVGLDDVQALHRAEDGLRGREDAVGEHHRHGQHADRLQQAAEELAPLERRADPAAGRPQVAREVAFHVDELLLAGVAVRDARLWITIT